MDLLQGSGERGGGDGNGGATLDARLRRELLQRQGSGRGSIQARTSNPAGMNCRGAGSG